MGDIVDVREKFDVFIITNGRSTFEYCHRAIKEQVGVLVNVHVVEGMKWVEANNHCLTKSAAGFFLRVDDDMILHPKAVLFISQQYDGLRKKGRKRLAMKFWKLWEPWRHQPVNAIKLYNRRIVRKLGGFKANRFGKIDAAFKEQVNNSRYSIKANRSMIGIHACGTAEENIEYAKMRGEHKSKDFKKKSKRLAKDIGRYTETVEYQYRMATEWRLENINKRYRTDFYRFTGSSK